MKKVTRNLLSNIDAKNLTKSHFICIIYRRQPIVYINIGNGWMKITPEGLSSCAFTAYSAKALYSYMVSISDNNLVFATTDFIAVTKWMLSRPTDAGSLKTVNLVSKDIIQLSEILDTDFALVKFKGGAHAIYVTNSLGKVCRIGKDIQKRIMNIHECVDNLLDEYEAEIWITSDRVEAIYWLANKSL